MPVEITEKSIRQLLADLDKEANRILLNAQKKADDIIADAKAQAKKIVDDAKADLNNTTDVCIKDINETCDMREKRNSAHLTSMQKIINDFNDRAATRHNDKKTVIQGSFSTVQQALEQANSAIAELDKIIYRSNTEMAYDNLSYIATFMFNLYKSYDEKLNGENLPKDLVDEYDAAKSNYEQLLEIVIESLQEYGITTIMPSHGDKLDNKYHEVVSENNHSFMNKMPFASQKIDKCIGIGFAIGEVVKVKAKVIV